MRVFLTGGAGFIGSHVGEALLERGAEVWSLDNFDPFYDRTVKEENLRLALTRHGFRFIEGDFRDAELLRGLLSELRPDAVLHLGAKAGVRPSVEDPLGYVSVNVTGTAILLDVCRELGIDKVLFASSSSVYGDDTPVPFREDAPANRPASPYAATKKAGEEIAHAAHNVHGLDFVCLRYFTVYGPRQRPEMAIHKFARKLVEGRPLTLYGGGALERDYTYITDAVAGTLGALDFLLARRPCFEILNVGGSRRTALHELLRLLEEALGARTRVTYADRPAGDVERTSADISKAQRLIGYAPEVPIEEGIRLFARWFTDRRARTLAARSSAA